MNETLRRRDGGLTLRASASQNVLGDLPTIRQHSFAGAQVHSPDRALGEY